MSESVSDQQRIARLTRTAATASVTVASILIALKFSAWVATESVAMLSTLVDSVLDALASIVNLLAVRHALAPADAEHRFGHGKAEPLAALAQSTFISGSALFLLLEAGERLIKPRALEHTEWGIVVLVISIGLTLGLVIFQRYVVKQTRSVAIGADSLHYQTDLYVNLGVILSLVLVATFGWRWADPVIGLIIAAVILNGAWGILKISLRQLMDQELPDDQRQRIKEIAMAAPAVKGVHDLRTRESGNQTFIQLHIELRRDMLLHQAHEEADKVMYALHEAFPGSEVIIHQDPEGVDEERDEF